MGRPETNQVRDLAMNLLGNGLSSAGRHEDALSVREAELARMRRFGAPEESILVAQDSATCMGEYFFTGTDSSVTKVECVSPGPNTPRTTRDRMTQVHLRLQEGRRGQPQDRRPPLLAPVGSASEHPRHRRDTEWSAQVRVVGGHPSAARTAPPTPARVNVHTYSQLTHCSRDRPAATWASSARTPRAAPGRVEQAARTTPPTRRAGTRSWTAPGRRGAVASP